ncbi:alpha/beta hydrolase fold domain-containing protein [Bacillus sp. ISL-77]|uniref:alpha/beta hydrolase fold domain-containing protein n=2 Tax=unclassified Bacillus (in: firmicutes) TaxID=185979 RepID=UPI001BE72382|nr:alpha/beta hydrolase [Bacillus sp. ISL-77]MBT2743453.1 alpha/beta hydrolase fold domain-containing protein [Bacillus sp. ISL-77]
MGSCNTHRYLASKLSRATAARVKDEDEALPALAVLLSPWTDMEGTGESMETRADADPWLSPDASRAIPALFIRDMDPRHPLVSPIYADLSGLPSMLVHVGNDEILLSDSARLLDRARAAGVEVTFKVWDEMWHVFQTFDIPEGQQAIDEIGDFVQKHLEY